VNVLQLNSQKIKSRQHLQVGGFFSWSVKRLLLTWRQIRAAAMRHFCRHADAFAQRGVGVDGFADVYGVCAHFDGQSDLANHVARVRAHHAAAQDLAVAVGLG
jgi:hypothetical protein